MWHAPWTQSTTKASGPSLPGLAPGDTLSEEHAGRRREDDEGDRQGANTSRADLGGTNTSAGQPGAQVSS